MFGKKLQEYNCPTVQSVIAISTRYPLLTWEQERELALAVQRRQRALAIKNSIGEISDLRWCQMLGVRHSQLKRTLREGEEAVKQLVLSNLRLVVKIANQYRSQKRRQDYSDMVQEGFCGLIRASEKFDPNFSVGFASYAAVWIHHAIRRSNRVKGGVLKLPIQIHEDVDTLEGATKRFQNFNGRVPLDSELAKELGWDKEKIHKLRQQAQYLSCQSLDEFVGDGNTTLLEMIESNQNNTLHDIILNEVLSQSLTPKQYKVITRFYGVAGAKGGSLTDISQELQVSAESVRQLKNRGLERLRELDAIREVIDL